MIDYIYLGGVLAFYSAHLYHVFRRQGESSYDVRKSYRNS